ncbi:hypothetical protein FQR65_LT01701 [Abscondita terminalis]|nr:hypothetical protein FQR65_LT01701 [Abscondita terminalis]
MVLGDLLVLCANEKRWFPRKVTVRGGQLLIGGDINSEGLRIALRHLSLSAGALPNSFALCKGQNAIITIQTASQRAFKLWVKTIAIELIRQTPLEAVKYLDILNLTGCWSSEDSKEDWFCNGVNHNRERHCRYCVNFQNNKLKHDQFPNEKTSIEILLKKCQNSEKYVPVKEKLVLFESLCRLGRKVRSTEDVSFKINLDNKRASSMHDLSSNSTKVVRQICKYFEDKKDHQENLLKLHRTNGRLMRSDAHTRDFELVKHRKENFRL